MESVEMRYSLGFFSFQEGNISTPEEMVDKDHPLAYKPFRHDGLLEYYDTLEVHLKAHRTMTKAYCGIPQTWSFSNKIYHFRDLIILRCLI